MTLAKQGEKKHELATGLAVAVTAGALTAGVYALSDYLLELAIGRKTPVFPRTVRERVTGHSRRAPSASQREAARKWLLAQPQETWSIHSRDGLRLVAHWVPAENARRTVVLMHGWRSSWLSDFSLIAPFFLSHGCNLLMPEQRGQGASEGKYIGFGVLEQTDCLDWVHTLIARRGDRLPIYLQGVSMGATTVLMASGHPLPDCVHGLVADCGFTSPYAIISHCLRTGLPHARQDMLPLVNLVCRQRAGYSFSGTSTVEAMRDNTKPVLFVHGDADTFVPMAMTLENYVACRAPKELLLVEGAGHALSYWVDRPAYEKALLEFYGNNDL